MQRRSDKHGPRVDEEMTREISGALGQGHTGARAEEWRQAEPAGEDQPEISVTPHRAVGDRRTGTPKGMSPSDIDQRSELARHLSVSALPGDREVLLASARENDAPASIIAELDRLPPDTEFQTVSEVWAALGHSNEQERW